MLKLLLLTLGCQQDYSVTERTRSMKVAPVIDIIGNHSLDSLDPSWDADGDGFVACGDDCDDCNASIHPDGQEVSDGLDDGPVPAGPARLPPPPRRLNRAPSSGVPMSPRALPTLLLIALLPTLAACAKDVTQMDDTEEPQDTEPQDTEVEIVDNDLDGFPDTEDCNDNDATINPEAVEICDGVDNNCDEAIDEGFDADEDGQFSAEECAEGQDCDDSDASIYLGAEEVPYDGIDQDCDGADVVDVDADGFVALEAGGDDCDDADPSIYPGALEVAKDGIDQDCDGLDSFDSDGDGFDDVESGGEDCDDSDPAINPSANDYKLDGVDADCNGRDGGRVDLESSDASIEGVGTSTVSTTLTGRSVAVCDVDDDGLDDLVVGAPFSNGYTGQVGIWYGKNASTWTAAMAFDGADTLITGGTNGFVGFEASCGDLNGDGYDDVFFQRGEIDFSTYQTDFGLLVFYGDGSAMSATVDTFDSDAELTLELGVEAGVGTVVSGTQSTGEVNGDTSLDVIFTVGDDSQSTFDFEERVLILPGSTYSGDQDMSDYLSHVIAPGQPAQLSWAGATEDLDGDGSPDLVVLSNLYTSDLYDTGDTGDTGFELEGRADFVGALPSSSSAELSLDDLADGAYVGSPAMTFGFRLVEGDFDGDGVQDLVISSTGPDADGTANTGGLFFFSNAGADLASSIGKVDEEADAICYGDRSLGVLGWELVNAGDVDGDGADDLIASKPDVASGYLGKGDVYLILGSTIASGSVDWEDTAYMHWRGPYSEDGTGDALATGDFDGDGAPDLVVGEASYNSGQGRVYVHFSSSW